GIKQGYAMQIGPNNILPILILGLLNTGIGCYFYFSSIGKLKVQTVAICGYLEPLSAVLFSVSFLKETMLPLQIIGAVLIIGGAMIGELVKPKRTKSSTQ
ncbi:MAG: DMT family transporter, partial [Oscillospiraceae bacterium]|nr:DMT family transporter [Oscillospiraceae bacterium]